MGAIARFSGVCPKCGRRVATTSDGFILKDHRPDPNKKSALCMAWGTKAKTFEKVEKP